MNKFIDHLQLTVISGNGGPGAVSFRKEKYIERGGPDGGDGGKGGDVIFVVKKSLSSFASLYSRRKIVAENGVPGMRRMRHGSDGEDAVIEVPIGTVLKDMNENLIFDFTKDGESYTLLKGGKGGRGNIHFATSVNQAPTYAQPGIAGEEATVTLEIKLIADVGLVGLPNVGKSTLISVLTNAHPKIANYHFTTLSPQLGIYNLDMENSIIIADIPGIIEGAHLGKGLGLDFLRHIERTSFLFFIIEAISIDPYGDFLKLKNELKSYSKILADRDYVIGISKLDVIHQEQSEIIERFPEKLRDKIFCFSSMDRRGLDRFKKIGYDVLSLRN